MATILWLFACTLLAAGVTATQDAPLSVLRLVLLLGAAGAAAVSPRRAIVAVTAVTPLLPIASRVWAERTNLSFAEHLVVGVLAGGLVHCVFRRRAAVAVEAAGGAPGRHPASTARIDAALAGYVAVVVASLAFILLRYSELGVTPLATIWESSQRQFDPAFVEFGQEPFLIVRDTLVVLVGAAWWYLLRAPAVGIESRGLQRALLFGLVSACMVAVAQWQWGFGAVPSPDRIPTSLLRLTGSWHDNNTFGVYLVLVAPLALMCARQLAGSAAAALAAAVAFVLLHTGSRGAWAATGACVLIAVAWLLMRGGGVGLAVSRLQRQWIAGVAALAATLVVGVVATVTWLDLGRSLSQPRLAGFGELVVLSANMRRPAGELLSGRTTYWDAAVSLWMKQPLLGCGIGRYRMEKLAPKDGTVARGVLGSVDALPGDTAGSRIRASAGVDFVRSNVLPGDTVESASGGWGPVTIAARRSPTELVLEQPVPTGSGLDFVVRHPEHDPQRRMHVHRGAMPFFTTAHNQYLQVLSELGVVGLAAFALLMLAIGADIRRAWRSAGAKARQRMAGAVLGLLGFAIVSAVQDPLTVKEMQIVFWAVVAAAVLEGRAADEPLPARPPR